MAVHVRNVSLNSFDVVVIGSGHAGCEAALAAARSGSRTLAISPNLDRTGYMPCNPSIGGPGKSQIVAEIDALGGAMAEIADVTALQVRELNTSKGPAVRAIRAQCDKSLYAIMMKDRMERQDNLEMLQDEAIGLRIESGKVTGVETRIRGLIETRAVVVTAGTFLRARMISGETISEGGRAGDHSSTDLSGSLLDLGIKLRRFKTGTPPRLDSRTIDASKLEPQSGDDRPLWLSREGKLGLLPQQTLLPNTTGLFADVDYVGGRQQLRCFQSHTNELTHDIIRRNLDRAPMYNGSIEGTGPRYCPSIEDKIGRFADKTSHPLFLEPEGWRSNEVYVQGLSTSLPADVQDDLLRTIHGLKNVRITRYGYAVEYDSVAGSELLPTLGCRRLTGLYMAGQINGTSGYEEAAGQGVVAGYNAANWAMQRDPLVLNRQNSYIGVMIDDLVTQVHFEPYRMLTSRAEFRLILRSDTADQRMIAIPEADALITTNRRDAVAVESGDIATMQNRLSHAWLGVNDRHAAAFASQGIQPPARSMTAEDIARRPGVAIRSVIEAMKSIDAWKLPDFPGLTIDRAEVAIKYGSFIVKERNEAARHIRNEHQQVPANLDFADVQGLRIEAMQKLTLLRPSTVGQAVRTAGVTPSDIGALLVHLTKLRVQTPREIISVTAG
ncbi:MAG: tRNA uridine-5-carboxymethylaminomethyl(34) synthesis enzyme MnmG [Thermomicrobiales bacterium]